MKKIGVMVVATVMIALSSYSQIRLGVHASGIGASGKFMVEDYPLKLKTRFSWKAGVMAEIPIAENFVFLPELNILNKGGKLNYSYEGEEDNVSYVAKFEGKFKLTYLELPLNVAYKYKGLFVGAGLSASFGISGKAEGTSMLIPDGGVIEEESFSEDIKFDGEEDASDEKSHLKAFELGANFIAGYEFSNRLCIRASYNLGLSNISPEADTKFKNRYFGIGVGYFFGSRQ